MTTKTILQYVLLSIVLGFGAFLAYQPHIDNPFPLLADEFVHISLAKQLLDEGTPPFSNPYMATETLHVNYESGFHFFLAFLLAVTPGEPVLIYQYFATAFFLINGLLLFYLVKIWSKKYTTAIFSLFFFGTITSADGLLAHQYFVPLTIGVTLLLVAQIYLYKLLTSHKKRYLALLVGSLLITAITYPPTLFFFLFTVGIYLFSMQHELATFFRVTRQTFFTLLFFASLLLAGVFFGVLAYLQLLDEIILHTSWSIISIEYSPIFFFGIVPSVLALIGIWSSLREKVLGGLIVLIWFLYSLIALYLFYLFEYSLLVPYPRLFFFYLISVSILAGYGANMILTLALSQSGNCRKLLLILALCIGVGFHVSHTIQSAASLPAILTSDQYEVLTQFAELRTENAVVISDSLTSITIYPITGNKVLNILNNNIGGGDSATVRAFIQASCAEKKELLYRFQPYLQSVEVQNSPFFVVLQTPQSCDFWELLPESGPDIFMYMLDEGTLSEFQHKINLEKVPTPSLVSNNIQPLGTLTTEAELINLVSGNSLVGENLKEYYHPDGRISGLITDSYTGAWKIINSSFCIYYPVDRSGGCRSIKKDGKKITLYTLDGKERWNGNWEEGNPFDL
jgi:hypothetical protein